MRNDSFLLPTETMKRLTPQELCDNFDAILEDVDQENTGYVITDKDGNDNVVLCPARWFDFMYDHDFGCVISSAIRYAIGRHTYMPESVVRFVRKYLNTLDTQTIMVAINDIDEAVENSEVPEKQLWLDLRNDLQKMLDEMNGQAKNNGIK